MVSVIPGVMPYACSSSMVVYLGVKKKIQFSVAAMNFGTFELAEYLGEQGIASEPGNPGSCPRDGLGSMRWDPKRDRARLRTQRGSPSLSSLIIDKG